MNRNTLGPPGGGQKFLAIMDLQFRPEVVKASGASTHCRQYRIQTLNQPIMFSSVID
jgi:hypothetical protein